MRFKGRFLLIVGIKTFLVTRYRRMHSEEGKAFPCGFRNRLDDITFGSVSDRSSPCSLKSIFLTFGVEIRIIQQL